jgi:hypothetical protein
MGEEHGRYAGGARHLGQRGVTRTASRGLYATAVGGVDLHPCDATRNTQPGSKLFSLRGPGIGHRVQAVMHMEKMKKHAALRGNLGRQYGERRGVGAAAHGRPERDSPIRQGVERLAQSA